MKKIEVGDRVIDTKTGQSVVVKSKEWKEGPRRWKWVISHDNGIGGSVWTILDSLESLGYTIDLQHYRDKNINNIIE
jgi:hypothetical protein